MTSDLQFAFKEHHSTVLYSVVLIETVSYFRERVATCIAVFLMLARRSIGLTMGNCLTCCLEEASYRSSSD